MHVENSLVLHAQIEDKMANGENYNWEIMKNVGQLKAISVPCCCWQVWGSYTDFLLFSSPFFKSRELNK